MLTRRINLETKSYPWMKSWKSIYYTSQTINIVYICIYSYSLYKAFIYLSTSPTMYKKPTLKINILQSDMGDHNSKQNQSFTHKFIPYTY